MRKTINRYRNVYDNWYVPSCKRSNEQPVSFHTYMRFADLKLIMEIEEYMEKNKK